MNLELIKYINNFSKQPKFSENLEYKLQRFRAKEKIILFDADLIDIDEAYEFCKQREGAGVSSVSYISKMISALIVDKFYDSLKEILKEIKIGAEKIHFDEKYATKIGFCEFEPFNNGSSLKVRFRENENAITDYCELHSVLNLENKEYISAKFGNMKFWQFRYTEKTGKNIKSKHYEKRRLVAVTDHSYRNIDIEERIQNDPIIRQQNALRMLFPDSALQAVMLVSPRDLFESNYARCSPLVDVLHKTLNSRILVHSLTNDYVNSIAKKVWSILNKENPRKYDINNVPSMNELKDVIINISGIDSTKNLLINLIKNSEKQLNNYVFNNYKANFINYSPEINNYHYIIKKLSLKCENSAKLVSFMKENIIFPALRIIKTLNKSLSSRYHELAYEMVFNMHDLSNLEPSKIVKLNIFPYNFPHLYLQKVEDCINKSNIKSISDLEHCLHEFQLDIEADEGEDITMRAKRYPGSFEMGGRR
jgi:hypothetical protein